MSRPPVSLQTRLIAASAVLAVLVIGVFVAMVLAVSAARTAANQEARSKNVTTSALQLEKLVLDLEAGIRGYVFTGNTEFLQPYTAARPQLRKAKETWFSRHGDEPDQRRQARRDQPVDRPVHGHLRRGNVPSSCKENPDAARDS